MVFSSLQFIFIFMPIFFGCYYYVGHPFKNLILLLGSLTFYFVGTIDHPAYLILFIISICADFGIGLAMDRYPQYKKLWLFIGILFHCISIFIFKYLGFVLNEINHVFSQLNLSTEIVLPIGISFYTFQGISYLADVYKGKIKAEKSLLRYAVFLSMFEQLIAGPIVTYGQVKKELQKKVLSSDRIIRGIATFVFGLGLKVLLANPIGKLWSQTCAIGFESISTPLAWLAIYAYTFQIYFDFWGYSLMAIGLGKMLGFHLPQNFNHPYLSLTMTDFWRRWHITLGSWFKEYVYIPLGGNRHGPATTIRNLLIVWLLTGIWHGAGYHFILWGFTLFIIIIIEKYYIGTYLNNSCILGHLYMAFMIPMTWAIFAIDNMSQLTLFYSRLFPFFGQGFFSIFPNDYIKYFGQFYPFFIAGILCSTKIPFRILKKIKNEKIIYIFLTIIFLACIYCMYRGLDDPFLYFRF